MKPSTVSRWFCCLVPLFLVATSQLSYAATIADTSTFSYSSVTNSSTKTLMYSATQQWGTTGGNSCFACLPLDQTGLPAGEYEVSFDFMMTDMPDSLVINFRSNNGSDNSDWQNTVCNPGKMLSWQHATATYSVTASGSDVWTGRLELYCKLHAEATTGLTDGFIVYFDNIQIRRISDSVLFASENFEADDAGDTPAGMYGDQWTWGDDTITLNAFKVAWTPTPLLMTDFETATVKSYANSEVINSGNPTIDDLTARLTIPGSQVAQVVSDGGRMLQFTDNSTTANYPRVYHQFSGVTSDGTGNNEVTILFDLTPLDIEGQTTDFRILMNSGTSQTSNGTYTALQLYVSDYGGITKISVEDGTSSFTSATLTRGTTYRFAIVADMSSTTQDLFSLRVAPLNDLNHPVVELDGIATRAANVTPAIIVFDGGPDANQVCSDPYIRIDNISMTAARHLRPSEEPIPQNTLWQIGFEDSSYNEMAGPGQSTYTIPSDWETRTDWSGCPRMLARSTQSTLDLSYSLSSVPLHGVEFEFRSMRVSYTTPELAVYSNGQFAGMIQTRGTRNYAYVLGDYRDVYRLYIPAEMLQSGSNELRLEVPLMPFSTNTAADWGCVIGWDYLRLTELTQQASEPIHGRMVYAGTNFMQNNTHDLSSYIVPCLQPLTEWMGIAYSGNTMRTTFWINRTFQQPARMDILETYRDLNLSVIMDYISGAHVGTLDPDGTLNSTNESSLNSFFSTYGNLFQYYEISNEPCLIGNESLAKEIALAQYINQIKPSSVKTAEPGYAFATSGGDPDGWAADPFYRLQLAEYCDTIGGHSYGTSFGAFMQEMASYGPNLSNGFPKEFILTEHGSLQWHHVDISTLGSSQPHAAAFDRNMRNLIAVADRFMYHAPFFYESAEADMNLFEPVSNWSTFDPTNTQIYPGVSGEEDRMKTYRRLALAYATHGQPLPYEVLNAGSLEYKRVYVRPVDTSALAPLPGSGATSDKVLLNFVNFEPTTQVVQVRIYLPASGTWTGRRIGAGTVLSNAFSNVSLNAVPYVDISETLPAHESVQYILEQ